MCLQNLMKFHQLFLKLLRKQNVTDTRTVGGSVGRSDNVKTVYPPTNTVWGGYNEGLIGGVLLSAFSLLIICILMNERRSFYCA